MQVQSCNPSGMTVDPKTYNACTFEIIDKWDSTQHAKTCDTMFYLRDGTGAYVWDCNKWIFLDFTGFTEPDWEAEPGEAGHIKNKPFQTLGNGLVVDENGVLSVCVKNNYNLLPNSSWNLGKGAWLWTYNWEIVDPEADKPNSHILHSLANAAGTQQAYQFPHPIYVNAGEVITIAFDYKDINWTKNINMLVMRVFPERDTPQGQSNSLQNVSWQSSTFGITSNTPNFVRFVKSFTVSNSGWLNVIPYNSDNTGNYESWWRELMVIRGVECEIPNEWFSNPADYGSQSVLYDSTGQNIDGAMTQKAVSDELGKKLSKVQADALYPSLTEPNHILGPTTFDELHFSSDTAKIPLIMDDAWTANSHYAKMTNGVLSIHIWGIRPIDDGFTGVTYPVVAQLPEELREFVNDGDIQFMWSNIHGGQDTYAGKIEKLTGNIILYLMPNTKVINSNHRFSVYISYIPV